MSLNSLYQGQELQEDENIVDEVLLIKFNIGEDVFSVDLDAVNEVCEFMPYVVYPYENEKHIGIINLRGTVLPIRAAFKENLRPERPQDCKYIIFSSLKGDRFGVLVESVTKVTVERSKLEEMVKSGVNLIKIDGKAMRYFTVDQLLE